ncbi:MAG: DEAD/DEAH box helicase [Candidatus Woesearchaeota archaeon]
MERISLKNFEPRLYQQTILGTAVNYNTLVVLPTGLGKTAIALMLAVQRLNTIPNSKVVILAPTRPLVEQHIETFKRHLNLGEEYFAIFTGSVNPKKRVSLWEKARVIFSTPQGFENDIISSRIDISNVSLIVFDEAHRAVGNYSYVFIAEKYYHSANFPRILALTASPGSNIEKIREVCKNLFIENIEVRTEKDPDVSPYVKKIKIFWEEVVFPEEFKEIRELLKKSYEEKLLKASEILETNISKGITKKELLNLQNELHAQINETKNYMLMQASSFISQAIKIQHAIELLETQGISQLKNYFERFLESVSNTRVRATKNLSKDLNFRTAIAKTQILYEKGFEHPKIKRAIEIISEYVNNKKDIKIILFTQYRDSANKIIKELENRNIKSKIFVGQMKKLETGLSQKEQKQIIEDFRNNNFNVLVSTSVGEEGLDIPQVDLVIFYEPIPSAIRQIQRRGRTGRQEEGIVIILYTKDTRDEAYMWAALNKEKKMKRTLLTLKNELMLKPEKEKKKEVDLTKYIKNNSIIIIVDHREKNSRIIKELIDLGLKIELKSLETADYVLSDRVGVEVKTTYDFIDSIIDGRLLDQIKSLRENYERPLIVIEGVEDIYSIRQVHKNAINGMIATIIINYGIPIIWTKNSKETAELLFTIAKKEQEQRQSSFDFHSKKPLTLKEQQEYIVSSFPGIGSSLAKPLLKKFGTIKNIVNATEEELKKVDLIGDKKAKQIRRVLDSLYEDYLKEELNNNSESEKEI